MLQPAGGCALGLGWRELAWPAPGVGRAEAARGHGRAGGIPQDSWPQGAEGRWRPAHIHCALRGTLPRRVPCGLPRTGRDSCSSLWKRKQGRKRQLAPPWTQHPGRQVRCAAHHLRASCLLGALGGCRGQEGPGGAGVGVQHPPGVETKTEGHWTLRCRLGESYFLLISWFSVMKLKYSLLFRRNLIIACHFT